MTELLPCKFCGRNASALCGCLSSCAAWGRSMSGDDRLELAKLERDEARDRLLPLKERIIRLEKCQHDSDRLVDRLRFERDALARANDGLAAETSKLRSELANMRNDLLVASAHAVGADEMVDEIARLRKHLAEIDRISEELGMGTNATVDEIVGEVRRLDACESEFHSLKKRVAELERCSSSPGVWEIATERESQLQRWTSTRDPGEEQYQEGEAPAAASCLAAGTREIGPIYKTAFMDGGFQFSPVWPFKMPPPIPSSRLDELAKAGALIAAEIDRLKRLQAKEEA